MKIIMRKWKQTMAILLTAAIVATSLPQTGSLVYAAEQAGNTDQVSSPVSENGAEDGQTENDSGSVTGTDGNDGSGDDGTNFLPEEGKNDSPAGEENGDTADSGTGEDEDADNADVSEEGDSTQEPEEDLEEEEAENELEYNSHNENTDSENAVPAPLSDDSEDGDEVIEYTNITIILPTNTNNNKEIDYSLSEFLWASDGNELESYSSDSLKTDSITFSLPKKTQFRFKPVLNNKFRLDNVRFSDSTYNTTLTPDEDGVYTLEEITSDYCTITINATRVYAITFDVENAQIQRVSSEGEVLGDITETLYLSTDDIGNTKNPNLLFRIVPNDGYVLRTVSSNSLGISLNKYKSNSRIDYSLRINTRSDIRDVTKIFVIAEEAADYHLTLNYPKGLTASVYADKGTDNEELLTLDENHSVSVKETQKISVQIGQPDSSKGIYAAYEAYGETTALPADTFKQSEGSNVYDYSLGALDGDVTLNFSIADLHRITFQSKQDRIISVNIYNPFRSTINFDYSSEEEGGITAQNSILVPDGYQLKFLFDVNADCNSTVALLNGIEPLERSSYDEFADDYVYVYTPTDDVTITLEALPEEYVFNYSEDEVDIRVYDQNNMSEPLSLSENKSIESFYDMDLLVKVKPAEGKRLEVSYEGWSDVDDFYGTQYLDYQYDEEDSDGYCYYYKINTSEHKNLTIRGYDTCTLTFTREGTDEFETTIERVVKVWEWDEDESWYWESCDEEIKDENPITVLKNQEVFFRVNYDTTEYKLEMNTTGTTTGTTDTLEAYAYDMDGIIYRLVPTEPMSITVKTSYRESYNVHFTLSDPNFSNWSVDFYDESDSWTKVDANTYTGVKEGAYVYVNIGSTGNRPEISYTVGDGEPVKANVFRDSEDDRYVGSFLLNGNTEVSIDFLPVEKYTVTFENTEMLSSIQIWDKNRMGNMEDGEDQTFPNVEEGKIELSNDRAYTFFLTPAVGYALDSITLIDQVTGQEMELEKKTYRECDDGDCYLTLEYYDLGAYGRAGDLTIRPSLSEGCTLFFDTADIDDEIGIRSLPEHYSINGSTTISKTDSFSFYIFDYDYDSNVNYEVSVDSEQVTLTKDIYYGYEYDSEEETEVLAARYYYTIAPKQGEQLPKQVTVSIKEPISQDTKKHEITLEYPETVRYAYVGTYELDGFNRYRLQDNKRIVSENDRLFLRISPVRGYTPTVTKQSASDEEPVELTPYRYTDVREYYLGNLTEDTTIRVTATRGNDPEKYYDVYFNGENVAFMDALYQTIYEYEEGFAYASVIQGQSISFSVTPYYGYDIQSVSIDGVDITPEWDDELQMNVYTVTPTKASTIHAVVSKPTEPDNPDDPDQKHTITFTYPDTVSSVIVKDYTLEGQKLNVTAGKEISFKIALTDAENYEIASVKANGVDVVYDTKTGYYVLTTGSENMEVVITVKQKSKEQNYTVSFTYPDTVESVTVKDYMLEDQKLDVPAGKEVSFKVALADAENYEITSVKANGIEVSFDAASGYYVIPACTEDTEVVITVEPKQTEEPSYVWIFKEVDTGNEITGQNDIFWIDAGKKYLVELSDAEKNIALTKVTLRDGISDILKESALDFENEKATASFAIDQKYAGKALKLKLYTESNDGTDVTTIFTLRVRSKELLTSVSIAGVTGGKLEQSVDTRQEYPITFTPENADNPVYAVDVTPADGKIVASVKDNVLTIDTSAAKENDSADIKIYNTNASTADQKNYLTGGTFTVTVVSPKALENGTPAMTCKGIDDVSLTLTLRAPNGVEPNVVGRQYYKFIVTPIGTDVPETIRTATAQPYYIERTADTQDIELVVNNAAYGKGCAWNFDVSVTLIQTKDGEALTAENEEAKTAYSSNRPVTLSGLSTKDPSYETKLTFKKGTTTVYTGQKEAMAATVVFNKTTCFAKVYKVEDLTKLSTGSALTVWNEDDKIYVSASPDTQLGKHTLEVTAYGSDTMYKTRASLTVTVVKGIESLSVKVPTTQLYKKSGKAASIKTTPVYNEGGAAPKTKKVTWDIVDAKGNEFRTWDVLYGKLTVKNGKVTVDKSLVLSPDKEDNQFRIRATASDFEGNTVFGLSNVITLSDTAMEIGSIYLLQKEDTGSYKVIADNSDSTKKFRTDELFGAILVATKDKNALTLNQSYTVNEIRKCQISITQLTYQSSSKAVSIAADSVTAKVHVTKPANKIKLTLKTADGGNKKAIMQFAVVYASPTALRLDILDNDTQISLDADGESNSNNKKFAGTVDSVIKLVVQQKIGEGDSVTWNGLSAFTNYTLKVKGGKLLTSDTEHGIYTMVVNAASATVTLTDKTASGRAAQVYKIINTAYSAIKAPKVKTTYFNKNDAVKSLTAGSLANRRVELTFSGSYTQARLECDMTAKIKSPEQYEILEAATGSPSVFGQPISITGGKITVNFDSTDIPAGSYKLRLTLGAKGENGFVASAKPVNITLKVTNPKLTKGSFKPTASYKIDASVGASVTLGGTGKAYSNVTFTDLMNANIKGQENNFCDYFVLNNNTLSLKSNLTPAQIQELKTTTGKTNLTGYVSYKADCGSDGYGNPYETVTGTVKVTIKLK